MPNLDNIGNRDRRKEDCSDQTEHRAGNEQPSTIKPVGDSASDWSDHDKGYEACEGDPADSTGGAIA